MRRGTVRGLLPIKFTCSKQECFPQEEDVINPSRVKFAPFCVKDKSSSREQMLHSRGGGKRSQIPRRIVYMQVFESLHVSPFGQCYQGLASGTFGNQ